MKKSELLELLKNINDDDEIMFSCSIESGISYSKSITSSELTVEQMTDEEDVNNYFMSDDEENEERNDVLKLLKTKNVFEISIDGSEDYNE